MALRVLPHRLRASFGWVPTSADRRAATTRRRNSKDRGSPKVLSWGEARPNAGSRSERTTQKGLALSPFNPISPSWRHKQCFCLQLTTPTTLKCLSNCHLENRIISAFIVYGNPTSSENRIVWNFFYKNVNYQSRSNNVLPVTIILNSL